MRNSLKSLIAFVLLSFLPVLALAQDKPETFFVTGMGSTHELAVQNAASNALTTAVGKFVDVKTQIEKRTEIKDGVTSFTKGLTENFISSSNGTIERIEIVSSSSENGLFVVEAVVDVRMQDLKKAMAGRVEASKPMNKSLFSVIAANKRNADQRLEALVENIFLPSQAADAFSVALGDAFNLVDVSTDLEKIKGEYYRENLHDVLENNATFLEKFRRFLASTAVNYVVVPVEVEINSETMDAWEASVKNLSSGVSEFPLAPGVELYERHRSGPVINYINFFDDDGNSVEVMPGYIRLCFVRSGMSLKCYDVNGLPPALDSNKFPIFSREAPDYLAIAPDAPGALNYAETAEGNLHADVKVSLIDAGGAAVAVTSLNGFAGRKNSFLREFLNWGLSHTQPFLLEEWPNLVTSLNSERTFTFFDKKTVNVVFPLSIDQLAAVSSVKTEIISAITEYR